MGSILKCDCGSLNVFKLYKNLQFYKCKTCELVKRYPMPSPERLTQIYANHYSDENIKNDDTCQSSNEFAVQNYARFIASELLPATGMHLDYGCGEGKLVLELQALGIASVGFDEFHVPSNSENAFYSDYEMIEASKYDLITLIEVIEHFDELDFHLQRVFSLLKPGGILFVTTPNISGLKSIMMRSAWKEIKKDFHLYFFNLRSINFHLTRNGFVDVNVCKYRPQTKPKLSHYVYAKIVNFLKVDGTLAVTCKK
jgi:cyclopropane fatty-acyl-phospholipid synthase-like methyltransferase